MGKLNHSVITTAMLKKIPMSVHLDLTMRCNEICLHCYRIEENRPELTTEEIYNLLAQLADAGALYLTLSGGEVFLRRDSLSIIQRARALRFDVRVKTNGLLITRDLAQQLVELGVSQVEISVYSMDAARHDKVTQVSGSLTRTLNGALLLKNAGMRVRFNCPLMSETAEEFDALLRWGEAHGIKVMFDPTITVKNNGDRAPLALRVTRDQLRNILSHPSVNQAQPPALSPSSSRLGLVDDLPCSASHSNCYISPYGDVYPCVAMPVFCGNIRQRPFLDIWQRSSEMVRVRNIRTDNLDHCNTCTLADSCSRCPAQALLENGSLTGPSTAACQQAAVRAVLNNTFLTKEV